jgi:hypothetical protein
MAYSFDIWIRCDVCGANEFGDGRNVKQARKHVAEQWDYSRRLVNGKTLDLCPTCAKDIKDKKNSH